VQGFRGLEIPLTAGGHHEREDTAEHSERRLPSPSPRGHAFCWGANWVGHLGHGTQIRRLLPVPVAGLCEGQLFGGFQSLLVIASPEG
jgi:hypothetical protein